MQTLEGRLDTKESLELGIVARPKEELAELEKRYASARPHLSEDGERVLRRLIREAEQKVKALSQQPNSEHAN